MWTFNKKYCIAGSKLLNGITDYHCHILPGVDDGIKTIEDSLKALSMYEEFGIKEVWLTPHIMEDIPNNTDLLKSEFLKLKEAYKGEIVLHLSAENMLDNLFNRRMSEGDLMTIIDDKYILVETSYYNPPMDLIDILLQIKEKGYIPILAHPERYMYMDRNEYYRLKDMDISFQLNLPSLVDAYGSQVRKKAEWLLKNGFYNCYGTDLHNLSVWNEIIHTKMLTEKILHNLRNISFFDIYRHSA